MAKYEYRFHGNFDTALDRLHQGILSGSVTASFEDGSDYSAGGVRCAVRVYERYSLAGGNRLSLTLMLLGAGGGVVSLRHCRRRQPGDVS